jgi:hypothetical protein
VIAALLLVLCAQGEIPKFREQLVDDQLDDLWACGVADVNNDGKPDIIALNWNPAYVVWYENPTWKKRILIDKDVRELVAIQPIQTEGRTAFVLGAGYREPPDIKKGGGEIYLLRPLEAPEKPWTPIKIAEIPTLHRIHPFNGRDLVCSALHGPTVVLRRPASPYTDPWTRETVNPGLRACHNTLSVDWDGDGKEEIITASAEGLTLHRRNDQGVWEKRTLSRGGRGSGPDSWLGASEIAAGWLPGGRRYLATIEPHHGHQFCIYTPPDQPDQMWKRRVLLENKGGHTVLPVDFNRSGVDSLLVGFVGQYSKHPGFPIWHVFRPKDGRGEEWEDRVLDDTKLPGEDGAVADLNGDGKPDLVIAGGKRIKIYWNEEK